MEKAESAWLGMPRHSNTAYRLPENAKSSLHFEKPKCRLLFCSAGLTAATAFSAAAAAVAFFRFEYEFSQEEEYAGEHNQADDNILSHDDSILEEIW